MATQQDLRESTRFRPGPLNRSVEFFTRLGFKFNPQRSKTDENATCMIVG